MKRVRLAGFTFQLGHGECLSGIGSGTSMLGVEMNLAALDRFRGSEGCGEPSVLAAGVARKAADIGFIDGVQE